jgi:hypothetical protein
VPRFLPDSADVRADIAKQYTAVDRLDAGATPGSADEPESWCRCGGIEPSPGADVGGGEPSPGADVAWGEPSSDTSPEADVAGLSPVLAQMWHDGSPVPAQMWHGGSPVPVRR